MSAEPVRGGGEEILTVRGLTTVFRLPMGVGRAVQGVDLRLARGEKLAIVGESGSGKSVLALSILGLVEPPGMVEAGEVILNGRDLRRLSERELERVRGREISLVFQDPLTSLNPVKTIGYQIIEVIKRHNRRIGKRAAERRAVELLERVEIPRAAHRLGHYPHEYSGGMRQRVMIAIAMANDPDVLIADEPTTALDVTTQAQVLELLDRLTEERDMAVILVTHNLGVVAEFCHRVCVMYAGRFVEVAPAADLFAQPQHPYTKALLESVITSAARKRKRLASIPGFPPGLLEMPAGCAFEPRCPLGHGMNICRNQRPIPRRLGPPFASTVECHLAGEEDDVATSRSSASNG